MLQFQLDKQKELWQDMDKKLDKITLALQNAVNRISMENKENLNQLSDVINTQNHLLNAKFLAPAVDDKWEILSDIKGVLRAHDIVLENFDKKLTNIENVVNRASWETQTQELNNNISKKLNVLQDIEKKMINLENITATKELQFSFNRDLQTYLNRNGKKDMRYINQKYFEKCCILAAAKICLKDEHEKLIW